MPTLSNARIAALLAPYLAAPPPSLLAQLSLYLDLLLKWNARTNLTAIRDPEEIVRRHFGESLFAAQHLVPRLPANATLLDFGSGAGFPGLPIQLLYPLLRVTLAESQNKKASFLREAIRTLHLSTEVWPARVETLPPVNGSPRQFQALTLRAVDNMQQALIAARPRIAPNGWLATLSTDPSPTAENLPLPNNNPGFLTLQQLPSPTHSAAAPSQ
jgi:16S rRNA (guanine527-N7)-methyltransferase